MQFVGIFFPQFVTGSLENKKNAGGLHVTLAFRPSDDVWAQLESYINTEVEVEIVGYGNDGQNEGLLVEFNSVPYFNNAPKHITLSTAKGAFPVNTKNLEFSKEALAEFKKTHYVPDKIFGVVGIH